MTDTDIQAHAHAAALAARAIRPICLEAALIIVRILVRTDPSAGRATAE